MSDESDERGVRRLRVNGADRTVHSATVEQLIAELGLDAEGRGIAVAIDGAIVPRGEWEGTGLPPGASVEIVGAVQGG